MENTTTPNTKENNERNLQKKTHPKEDIAKRERAKEENLKEENLEEENKVMKKYEAFLKKRYVFLGLIAIGLVFFVLLGMTLGSVHIPLKDIFKAIFGNAEPAQETILWRIRLPRVIAAALAGICLSVSGAAMQSILRNPLGSPFTLGISHAAAFGAAFAVILFGAGTMHSTYGDAVIINNPYIVTLSAFSFCVLATLIILFVSRKHNARPQTMILMGVVLGSLFSAGSTAIQYFADDVQLAAIVFWTFGDLGRADWSEVIIIAVVSVAGMIFFYKNAWNYSVLDAGDEVAQSLGINITKTRKYGMIVSSLLTAIIISFFGIIAYIGLVVPHIVRKILGNEERVLIIGSGLFGGFFLLLADTVARTILSPVILPVGVLTSFLGAPLFIYLLIKKQK